jgi:hypothetical protein
MVFSPKLLPPQPTTGRVAPDREFLLPHHVPTLTVSALRKPGLALFFIHHGWFHARSLRDSFFRFPSL